MLASLSAAGPGQFQAEEGRARRRSGGIRPAGPGPLDARTLRPRTLLHERAFVFH